ncbi:hypothetical protein BDR03DRAFT_1093230 [Suillus americanus]|nr:hypothetical protein BDR03DRAFT_1093230 [Suillus americanus]
MAPAVRNVHNIPSAHLTSVAPSSTFASFYLTDGLPGSVIPQDVYFKGGSFCFSVVALSAIGFLYRSRNKTRMPRSDLRDLPLPAVVTCDNSDALVRPTARRLARDISAPCLVSSTNAALDPCYFESQTPYQLHSSVEVSPIACLSGMEFSNICSDTTHAMLMEDSLRHLHASTDLMEHSQSLPVFQSSIGESQHISEMESFYGSDFLDTEHHPYILSMPIIPRIALKDLSEDSITSVKKTYDFKITSVGTSVREGDFLQLPNRYWPRTSPSRSSPSHQGARRYSVHVVDIAKYTEALAAPVCRLSAFQVAHEDSPESRKESEDETENQASDIILEFIEDSCRQSDPTRASKKSKGYNPAPGFTSQSDGVLVKSAPVYPCLEPSAVVHFHGRHRRCRAASYQITSGILSERRNLIDIQPSSWSSKESRWAPENGMMVIKVYIPSTNDLWAAYVPTSVTLSAFTCKWFSKLSLHLRFSGSAMDTPEYYFDSDEVFQCWVKRRVRHGRNLPIVGHLDYAVLPLAVTFLPSFEGTWARLSQVAVNGAEYNSRERQPHPKCLEGTRVDLLTYIYESLDGPEKNRLIWLHGTAGVGKSAVAFTVAERMKGLKVTEETNVEKRLGGTFFFSRKHTKRCTAGYFFMTLAYQLATNFPSIRKDVNRAIRDNPALLDPDKSLYDQMEALFLQPLRKLQLRLRGCPPLTFVVDALDECTSEPELTDLILSLARALREPDLPVTHILLTSRPESHIRKAFQNKEVQPLLCEIPVKTSGEGVATIISLDGADVDKDIYIFLQHSFAELASRHTDFPQPSKDDLAKLASRAGRRFIVASTMMKFIVDNEDDDPHSRLQLMLKLTSELLPGTEVYRLYDCILSTCANPERAYIHLSIVAALVDPLPISQISSLLGPGLGRDVQTTLIQLRSVMDIPTDSTLPVNIYHSSIRDYVFDPSHCSLPQVREQNMPSPHSLLADSSFHLMMKNISETTALLDALSELEKQSQAMQPEDPDRLKVSLSFLVQSPEPLSVLICMLWLRGDRASDLQYWLGTVDGYAWVQTTDGRDWLQTEGAREPREDESG